MENRGGGGIRRRHTPYPKAVDDSEHPSLPDDSSPEGLHQDHPTSYDPDEFLIGSQDGNGHSARAWLRCNPGYLAVADSIVQSKVFPYRTASDLYRHALIRHVKWLKGLEPDRVSDLYHLAVIDLLNVEEQKMIDFKLSIERTSTTLTALRASNQFGRARSLLSQILYEISMMQSDWKQHYLDALQPYMGMLDEKPGVKLAPGDAEE